MTPAETIVRDILRLLLAADSYPRQSNEDWRVADHMEAVALNTPEDRAEAAEALRCLIEKIVLRPGNGRGELEAMLFGDLGNILAWIGRQAAEKPAKNNTPIVKTMECRYRWLRGRTTTDTDSRSKLPFSEYLGDLAKAVVGRLIRLAGSNCSNDFNMLMWLAAQKQPKIGSWEPASSRFS